MADQLNEIWQDILAKIEGDLSKHSFETWLKSAKPALMDEHFFYVEVPNLFTKELMEEKFGDLLQESVKTVVNPEIKIKFIYNHNVEIENVNEINTPESASILNLKKTKKPYFTNKAETKEDYSPGHFHDSGLNPSYTFDTFVIGNCNRLAHAASLAVATSPSRAYNPLFIYGGTGLGKTHLLHAIGHLSSVQHVNCRVLYIGFERFTNEFINAIRDNKTLDFRNKYRNMDVLLIDDIQFLVGKEQTQEEFFHTFNTLRENNKQIVISSDRQPREIHTLEDRLRSRFEWGLIADIEPPDIETRIAILKKMVALKKIDLPDEIIHYIAGNIENNIRNLEGALNCVLLYASLFKTPVNLEVTKEALKNMIQDNKKEISINSILKIIADFYGIGVDEIKAKKRSRNIAFPRQVAMYLCRELTESSLPGIGKEFGGKDHSTVLHACHKIKMLADKNADMRNTLRKLTELITH